jgi:hypothetical protein
MYREQRNEDLGEADVIAANYVEALGSHHQRQRQQTAQ